MSIVDDKFFHSLCQVWREGARRGERHGRCRAGRWFARGVVLHNVTEATAACSAQCYVDCFEQIGFTGGAVRTNDDSAGRTKFCFVQVVGAKIVELDA